MHSETKFVEVVLPLALNKLYSYRVPRELSDLVRPGIRVVVQFGRGRKKYAALVRTVNTDPPKEYSAKYIDQVLDRSPIIGEPQLAFWDWIAEHYMCSVGEVMKAALPAQFKLSSETKVMMAHEDAINMRLDPDEFTIIDLLDGGNIIGLDKIEELHLSRSAHSVLNDLISKGAVLLEEEIRERYKPKIIDHIELAPAFKNENALQEAFSSLERAPKQLELLMKFIELSRYLSDSPRAVRKTDLQKKSGTTSSVTNQLIKKGLFRIVPVEVGRVDKPFEGETVRYELSIKQRLAFDQIRKIQEENKVALLHGVTASGKTEIYVELIREALDRGQQVLYLLPEIALTAQIVQRIRKQLGARVGIFHSKLAQNERKEIWDKVMKGDIGDHDVILGARSALFLPFKDLGAIVVDEEHDASYKQFDPAPRYNARDAAIVLAKQWNAVIVLGSATPSLESLQNARSGLFGYVELEERFGAVKEPVVEVASLAEARERKAMKGPLTPQLHSAIADALQNGEQVILFQNRRGFASWMECETCGWTPQCKNCDVSLTYHKFDHDMRCHYCGSRYHVPVDCGACGSRAVRQLGSGTEQIEEKVLELFPTSRIARMDLDTTKGKYAHQSLINDLEDGRIDILVGTQMVTKGLDLENVSLVGVINADRMLAFPDLRAHERAYHLMAQVAGRAGRRKKQGRVIIQASDKDHPVVKAVVQGNFNGIAEREMEQRKAFHYPPFTRLIRLTVRHRLRNKVENSAKALAQDLVNSFGSNRVLGPEPPLIERIRNRYLMNILIKVERDRSTRPFKKIIKDAVDLELARKGNSALRITIDVDPM